MQNQQRCYEHQNIYNNIANPLRNKNVNSTCRYVHSYDIWE